jgi:hypothetical protein
MCFHSGVGFTLLFLLFVVLGFPKAAAVCLLVNLGHHELALLMLFR